MTSAQKRLVATIERYGDCAEYWPVVNDWVKDAGPAKALAFRNINRTVAALINAGHVTIDDDGLFHVTARQESA